MLKFFRAEIGRKRRAVRREPFNTSLLARRCLTPTSVAHGTMFLTERPASDCKRLWSGPLAPTALAQRVALAIERRPLGSPSTQNHALPSP